MVLVSELLKNCQVKKVSEESREMTCETLARFLPNKVKPEVGGVVSGEHCV